MKTHFRKGVSRALYGHKGSREPTAESPYIVERSSAADVVDAEKSRSIAPDSHSSFTLTNWWTASFELGSPQVAVAGETAPARIPTLAFSLRRIEHLSHLKDYFEESLSSSNPSIANRN